MKIYHSFWDLGYSELNEDLYNMHKLSVLLALKNYGNIHLITTEKGKEFLGSLPYTSIEIFEEKLPHDLSDVWSLSKLYAYRQICKKQEPFLHIDYDVFLFKRIPQKFEKVGVLVQNIEVGWLMNFYFLDVFFKNCANKYLCENKTSMAYNMGIFGGNNLDAINNYVDEALKFLYDEENIKTFWKKTDFTIINGTKAVILEQFYLYCCSVVFNFKVTCLLPDSTDLDFLNESAEEIGYCHLWGYKYFSTYHDKIKEKIKELTNENTL